MALKTYLFDKSYKRTYLSPRHDVKTENGKKRYRLIDGDDELDVKKQGTGNVRERRIFIGSQLFSTDDVTWQKFIESKPEFGKLIKVYDPLEENKAKVDEASRDIKLMLQVAELPNDKLLALAWNIFGRDAGVKANKGDYDGIKIDVLAYTQKSPEAVKEILDDSSKSLKFEVGLALSQNIIEDAGTEVRWVHNGIKIITVPRETTAIQAMVDYYKEVEGREVRRQITTMMKEKAESKKASTKSESVEK